MIRDHAFGFAAIVAGILSVGGALAIVQAQQPPGGTFPAAGAGAKTAVPAAKGGANPGTGAIFGGFGGNGSGSAPVALPPGSMRTGSPGMPGVGMMGPMGIAIDDDPEMNELAQGEAALANESAEIVARFADTENAAERKPIVAELRATLAKQFDVQKKRREIELSRIEERVRKLRDQIKKRDDARETIIDRRLDQLVNDADGLGWSPPAGPAGRGSGTGSTTRAGVGRKGATSKAQSE